MIDGCQALADRGVPASTIEEQDFSPLLRAREEVGADAADAVRGRSAVVIDHLETLR